MEKIYTLIATALVAATLFLTTAPVFAADGQKVVNVNEADAGKLALLPRVGPALAERIIEFREANGKFKQPEDLMQVRGIGQKTFDLMKPYVATSGATTLAEKVKASQAAPAAGGDDKGKAKEGDKEKEKAKGDEPGAGR